MILNRPLFFALLLSVLAACAAPQPEPPSPLSSEGSPAHAERPPAVLTIIAISDFHGGLEPAVELSASGAEVEIGGAALMAAYIDAIRAQAEGPVLILDGGDMFQGTLVSNSRQGMPVVEFYNHIGVAAAALGNHEFDFGPAAPERAVALEPEDDPRGALREIIAAADYPILAANVFLEGRSPERPDWLQPSVILEADGLRIGVVGVATPSTPATTIPLNVVGLEFDQPQGWVQSEAERLLAEGADHVIMIGHIGAGCRDFSDPYDLSSCRDHELFEVLEGLPEGLLLAAVGGHTHQGVAHIVGGVPALQAFAQGRSIAWAELPLDGQEPRIHPPMRLCGQVLPEGADGAGSCAPNQLSEWDGELEPAHFLGREIAPDEAVAQLLEPELERVAGIRDESLGLEITETIRRAYREESALGNWIADMMLAAFQSFEEADVAVINAGGIRQELQAGMLSYGALFGVIPFDNRFASIELSGEELARIVRHGVVSPSSALLYSGLSFSAEGCALVSVEVGGEPLDESKTYRLITNDYLGAGGSGFNSLGIEMGRFSTRWELPPVRDAIADVLRGGGGALSEADVFDPQAPRQRYEGACDP